jgi:hypothetical protein
MPEISRFYGIVIRMYYDDHDPPHFHATYGEFDVRVEIATGVTDGPFPLRKRDLVLAWLGLHRRELLENWEHARASRQVRSIAPLE